MMKNLKIVQEHRNIAEKPFGVKRISSDAIDKILEREDRRIMKRRVLCKVCYTYKSTSGVCFC